MNTKFIPLLSWSSYSMLQMQNNCVRIWLLIVTTVNLTINDLVLKRHTDFSDKSTTTRCSPNDGKLWLETRFWQHVSSVNTPPTHTHSLSLFLWPNRTYCSGSWPGARSQISQWKAQEQERSCFTCRPLPRLLSSEERGAAAQYMLNCWRSLSGNCTETPFARSNFALGEGGLHHSLRPPCCYECVSEYLGATASTARPVCSAHLKSPSGFHCLSGRKGERFSAQSSKSRLVLIFTAATMSSPRPLTGCRVCRWLCLTSCIRLLC